MKNVFPSLLLTCYFETFGFLPKQDFTTSNFGDGKKKTFSYIGKLILQRVNDDLFGSDKPPFLKEN